MHLHPPHDDIEEKAGKCKLPRGILNELNALLLLSRPLDTLDLRAKLLGELIFNAVLREKWRAVGMTFTSALTSQVLHHGITALLQSTDPDPSNLFMGSLNADIMCMC